MDLDLKRYEGHTEEPWEVAKGGRSVNAGRFGKIRMEPGRPAEELQATMRLIADAPALLRELIALRKKS